MASKPFHKELVNLLFNLLIVLIMANKEENMLLWDIVKHTPEKVTKPFNNGRFRGTDIKPIWRLEILTQQFGACGFGWYIDDVKYWTEQAPNGDISANCELNLYVKVDGEWSRPIHGVGGNIFYDAKNGKSSDEGYKMAYSDAISVACKALGVAAEIYYGNPALDNSKYEQFYTDAEKKAKAKKETAPAEPKVDVKEDAPAEPSVDVEEVKAEISKAKTKAQCKLALQPYGDLLNKNVEFRNWAISFGTSLPA